ncbi:MAG: LptF/LptG family permease [Pseudobdellovibrionaceae bacterium]|jgi:lipopolysaccharide export system permease protein|nr:LptF/LptG family permease [Pseudobdellovibrionaceae bacterium]
MQIIDRYIFRQIMIATIFIVGILSVLVLLTQSLRYLDLVMSAGASGLSFWVITLLTLPSFFEVIFPISLVAAVLFVYHRLVMDSELFVLKALGFSPLRLARPALVLAVMLGATLFVVMCWIAPYTKANAIVMRKDIKAQMSSLIFREGVFTEAGKGLTVYMRERDKDGNLLGLVIHDARNPEHHPSTVIAARGVLVSTDDGHQVLVYDGSRQEYDGKTGVLKRLDFDRYTIDMPETTQAAPMRKQEPDEMLLQELLSPFSAEDTRATKRAYTLEIQKRVLTPLLVPALAFIALVSVLSGSHDRRGMTRRLMVATGVVVFVEIVFLTSYNLAKSSPLGFGLMILAVLLPILGSLAILCKDRLLQWGRISEEIPAEGEVA